MTILALPPVSRKTQRLSDRFRAWPASELFVFGILLIGAKTTLQSQEVLNVFAYGLMAVGAAIGMLRLGIVADRVGYAIFPVLLFIFAIFMGQNFTNLDLNYGRFFETLVSVAIGSCLIISEERPFAKVATGWVFCIGTLTYLAVTVATGGLLLDGLPSFNFEIFDDYGIQVYEVYSQGVTKLLALSAIVTLFWLRLIPADQKAVRRFAYVCLLLFSVMSLFGGARGEFIALVIIFLIHAFFVGRGMLVFIIGLFLVLYLVIPDDVRSQIVLINRLDALAQDDSLGGRNDLFSMAIDLILAEPGCAVYGCGIYYFQYYWGLILGFYPHNYILEMIISLGGVITVGIYVVYYASVIRLWRDPVGQAVAYILVYLFLVSMKSSSIAIDHLFWIFLSLQIVVALRAAAGAKMVAR